MHPVIRLLTLLVFAALVPWLPLPVLASSGALLLLATAWHAQVRRAAWQGLRRVRWLLLSVAVLYLWFSPGERLMPMLGVFSPTQAGLALALHRAGVLVVMVWAVAGVLGVTPARETTAALRQLLVWPFRSAVALRFADRTGLLLAELPRVQESVSWMRDSRRSGRRGFAECAAELVRDVELQAADDDVPPVPPLPLGPVPPLQWMLPVGLALGGMLSLLLW